MQRSFEVCGCVPSTLIARFKPLRLWSPTKVCLVRSVLGQRGRRLGPASTGQSMTAQNKSDLAENLLKKAIPAVDRDRAIAQRRSTTYLPRMRQMDLS
jgi:hypothetical protein